MHLPVAGGPVSAGPPPGGNLDVRDVGQLRHVTVREAQQACLIVADVLPVATVAALLMEMLGIRPLPRDQRRAEVRTESVVT